MKTENIYRIRMGISKNNIPLEDYVLSKFSDEENKKINDVLDVISSVIDDFASNDIDKLMEKYNRN